MPPPRVLSVATFATLVLALILHTPGAVTAQEDEPVTTVLQPGYNMAGWIEPETGVAELFEAIPELEAVYAWDAVEQRFRSGSAQREGDLTTLTPGMGLWLEIGGAEQVTWTRSGHPDPAAGLTTLREGWNLVAWSGSEHAAFEDAFAALSGPSQVVLSWDTEAQWFGSYVPGATSGGAQVVRLGDSVWVSSSGERHWLQPGSFESRVEFYGEFSGERKAEIRAETRSVVTWFAERYGLLEPGFELYVGADRDSLTQARREVLGRPNPSYVLCGRAVNLQVFMADWCITATHDLTSPLAHEYFHVLQTHLVERTPTEGTIYVADWLLEGTAEYAGIEYHMARGHRSPEATAHLLRRTMIFASFELDELETNISQFDTVGYEMAAFAVRWLVSQVGEDAVLDYFQVLPASTGWEDAFDRAFGRPVSAFYSELANHLADIRPEFWSVHVTVNDPDGNAMWEWNGRPISVKVVQNDPIAEITHNDIPGEDLNEDGATLRLPDGPYTLLASAACREFGGDFYSSVYYETIGYYSADGPARIGGGQEDLIVGGADLAVAINLPALPNEAILNCHDGPRFNINGTVVRQAGGDLEGYDIWAYPTTELPHGWVNLNFTDEAGEFTIPAPDGYSYVLRLVDRCGNYLGNYHDEEGLVLFGTRDFWERRTAVAVKGADVTGIRIVIPPSAEHPGC